MIAKRYRKLEVRLFCVAKHTDRRGRGGDKTEDAAIISFMCDYLKKGGAGKTRTETKETNETYIYTQKQKK